MLYWSARDADGSFGISSVPGSAAPSYSISGTAQIGSDVEEGRFGNLTLPAGDRLTVLTLANTGTSLQRIGSVSITAQPGAALDVTSFNFNPATSLLTLGFSSVAGNHYALEYTTGFQAAGLPTNSDKWNVVSTHSNILGLNGTTTITPLNVTTLLTPSGQLQNASKCFFRIRKL